MSVTYRQNDNYGDIYDGKMANCCQKVISKKATTKNNDNQDQNNNNKTHTHKNNNPKTATTTTTKWEEGAGR